MVSACRSTTWSVGELSGKAIDPVRAHHMRDVIDGIEKQKEEAQAALVKATGVTCPK
jgi:hypothetical protein